MFEQPLRSNDVSGILGEYNLSVIQGVSDNIVQR